MDAGTLPVILHLLADRQLNPGAVLVQASASAQTSLAALAGDAALAPLAARLPCLIAVTPDLPADLLASLEAAGCKPLDRRTLHRSNEPTAPVLPATAQWLDGDWLLAPPKRVAGAQSASRTLALKLLQLVMNDAETRDIEAVLRQDPTLSYHLLRLVNSLGMGLNRRITSFSQAIMILGRNQLRRWLNLMLFAARSDDHRAPMLLARVALRSRCMELMAKACGLDRAGQDMAFMVGMFSMLGVLFGTPLADLIKPLQLSDEMLAALMAHQGEVGVLLQLQEHAQQCQSAPMADLLQSLQLTPTQFTQASLTACQWMLDLSGEVRDD